MPEMETLNTRQWYAVHRYDGNVQYAVKYDDLYFLWGSGFGISKFDAEKVEPIEGEPPYKLIEGTVCLDGDYKYKGIDNTNHRWNGWACPWILAEDIERFIADMNPYTEECGVGNIFKLEGETLIIKDLEDPEYKVYSHKENLMGKDCYYLGDIGWCFEFKK